MKQTKYLEPNEQYYSRETDRQMRGLEQNVLRETKCFGDVQYAVLHILSKENPPQPLLISCATPNPKCHHSVTRPRRMCLIISHTIFDYLTALCTDMLL